MLESTLGGPTTLRNHGVGRVMRNIGLRILFILCAVEVSLWFVPLPDLPHPQVINRFLPSYAFLQARVDGDLPASAIFNSHGLRGVSSDQAAFTVNRLGYLFPDERSSRKSSDELRIGVIGGSTVECIALVDDKRWPTVLQRLLSEKLNGRPVASLNLGVSGQDTRSYLGTAAQVAVKLDLDYLVYLVGANDLFRTRPIFDPLADDSALLRIENSARSQIASIAFRFQLPRYARALVRSWRLPVPEAARDTYFARPAGKRMLMPRLDDVRGIDEAALSDYALNLISLDGLGRAHGIKSVFLTQPALWKQHMSDDEDALDWLGTTERDGRRFRIPGATSERLLDLLNSQLLATCRTRNLTCLDLAAGYPRDLDHFYDSVHFNERGAELVGSKVAEFIANMER